MKKRNLSANKTIHNFYLSKLKNPKIKKLYSRFKKIILKDSDKNYCVAISGGPDSMALAFLTKCMSIEEGTSNIYFHIDHNLRKESKKESLFTKKVLKEFGVNLAILKWVKNNKLKNIQEQARLKRYELLFKKCKNYKLNKILTAHHKDDLYENFFIRLLRGSGLNGLISFKKKYSKLKINEKILIFRPLLKFSKQELIYIAENTFGNYIKDPTNLDNNYLRVYVRNILNSFKFNKKNKNFDTSLSNLHKSNIALEHYIQKNIDKNVKTNKEKVIVNKNFFSEPDEVVFRSLNIVLNSFSNKLKLSRGSKIMNLINNFKNSKDTYKTTLSGCIFKKVNNTLIISREI